MPWNSSGTRHALRASLPPCPVGLGGGALFRLALVDTQNVLDKGTLETRLWDHLKEHRF